MHLETKIDKFVEDIENKIFSSYYKVGDKLPSERELKEHYHMCKTEVNSGLAVLKRKGFIKTKPRVGNFVKSYLETGNTEILNSIIKKYDGTTILDEKLTKDFWEFRIANDLNCVALAAKNRTKEDIDKLYQYYNEIKDEMSVEELSKLFFHFHRQLYIATNNFIYPLVYNAFKTVTLSIGNAQIIPSHLDKYKTHIKALITAIEKSDEEEAKQALLTLITDI